LRQLSISSYPRAILHIDGDAFFASCEQARRPELKGKPVITGKERGIASSMSYEAKARGVTRAMSLRDIKKICPDAIILPSDYETYSLLSQRFYSIVRRYTPDVEEYGIDECFADLTGMRRTHRTSYPDIAAKIKHDLDLELGFTFSVGLAPTKVLAKLGSKWKKPSGLTAIPGRDIHLYLEKLPVEKVWGIGPATTEYLAKQRITTALEFAAKSEEWIKSHLTKPHFEIWSELNGRSVLPVNTEPKTSYSSIQKFKTFTPPSSDIKFVFAQLSKNIENACIKARRYKLATRNVIILLRTQDFRNSGLEIKLSKTTAIPVDIIGSIKDGFNSLFKKGVLYRSTGVVLWNLGEESELQPDLFNSHIRIEKMNKIFDAVDHIKSKYGKHTLFLGSSFQANKFSQHKGERGDAPERKHDLFKGESARKRLAIPMLLADVS
jgi:DNA polymerase-4